MISASWPRIEAISSFGSVCSSPALALGSCGRGCSRWRQCRRPSLARLAGLPRAGSTTPARARTPRTAKVRPCCTSCGLRATAVRSTRWSRSARPARKTAGWLGCRCRGPGDVAREIISTTNQTRLVPDRQAQSLGLMELGIGESGQADEAIGQYLRESVLLDVDEIGQGQRE